MKLSSFTNINFQSGLTLKTRISEKVINTRKQEANFAEQYGIETHFMENKSIALANKLCADIFTKFTKKLNNFSVFPPFIIAYNQKNLIDKNSAPNFCIPDTKAVLNNDYPFPGRSLFFRNIGNLSYINDLTDYQFQNKKTSSSHFLAPFIHEWLHSFQLNYIYNKFGYGGDCDYLKQIYPNKKAPISGFQLLQQLENKTLSQDENSIIFDTLGEYATKPQNQYLEIFSEAFTKFICDSLNGIEIVKNPIDQLIKTNKDFQNVLKKVIRFQ